MGSRFTFSDLYKAPAINPVNRKARAVPVFNPINQYGRVFFFSWFGFMIAFWAWYSTLHSVSLVRFLQSPIKSLMSPLHTRFIPFQCTGFWRANADRNSSFHKTAFPPLVSSKEHCSLLYSMYTNLLVVDSLHQTRPSSHHNTNRQL